MGGGYLTKVVLAHVLFSVSYIDFGELMNTTLLGIRSRCIACRTALTPRSVLPIFLKLTSSCSVAELNAGIICSCMPVVFVVFKGFSKRIFHIPAVRYFRPRTKQSTGEDAGLAKPSVENDEVEIPRPVMTGLRSFIRRAHRTNPTKGDTTHIESYTELESLRDGYHTHLHPQKSQQNCSASAV